MFFLVTESTIRGSNAQWVYFSRIMVLLIHIKNIFSLGQNFFAYGLVSVNTCHLLITSTDLIGFILFVVLSIVSWFLWIPNPNFADVFVFLIFFVCAQCQMLFSTLFHTFFCHSPEALKWFARLDYTGNQYIYLTTIEYRKVFAWWLWDVIMLHFTIYSAVIRLQNIPTFR